MNEYELKEIARILPSAYSIIQTPSEFNTRSDVVTINENASVSLELDLEKVIEFVDHSEDINIVDFTTLGRFVADIKQKTNQRQFGIYDSKISSEIIEILIK